MSCQKGNTSRSRPQKYQNHTAFKNNLYDNSKKIKFINSIEVVNVCERCKKIIEWKIKYRKYKALKAPMKCIKCEQKIVKHSYHNICLPCAKQNEICPKCGKKKEIVEAKPNREELIKLDEEFKTILKTLSERKRRTFLRYMNQQSSKNTKNNKHMSGSDIDINKCEVKDKSEDKTDSKGREDLLIKLKSLAIIGEEDDTFNSDTDIESKDNNFSDDIA
ncbi:uncharacterized protein LOC126850107 [Cataglyphis hispanica]|uniref:uncharacterized protein LOC126850107 n=1 Tax=Cataglyphis hispanica TaxID=1086592 RepID=UPI00217FF77B|nr:uncharacterized protein LOC126850107 [Cataglyphis hispanica]XP_050448745.1 uncharacterized protein LOC126850107 [Cataglyphis hispanica]